MTYLNLIYIHLATILPAFFIGAVMLAAPKGTTPHRLLGRIYTTLMLVTAVVTLFAPAQVGPQVVQHFGFIHLFSVLVLVSIPAAVIAARAGNIMLHRVNMLGVYVGGILIAGIFALAPGRLLHTWLFS